MDVLIRANAVLIIYFGEVWRFVKSTLEIPIRANAVLSTYFGGIIYSGFQSRKTLYDSSSEIMIHTFFVLKYPH